MDSYQAGLQIDPENAACKQGYAKVVQQINSQSGPDQERAAKALQDPEIQQIMSDPTIRNVLNDMQDNPKYGMEAMKDPNIAAKIQRLIAAGVLSVK